MIHLANISNWKHFTVEYLCSMSYLPVFLFLFFIIYLAKIAHNLSNCLESKKKNSNLTFNMKKSKKKERKKQRRWLRQPTDIDIIMGYSISHEPYESYHDNLNWCFLCACVSIQWSNSCLRYIHKNKNIFDSVFDFIRMNIGQYGWQIECWT